MHQHPRTPPRTASPASSPWTNPTRTNNQRDPAQDARRRSRSEAENYDGVNELGDSGEVGRAALGGQRSPRQAEDSDAKLNQVLTNYYTKAALIIIDARMETPPVYMRGTNIPRINKWYNVEIPETPLFREELQLWKTCNVVERIPPPLVIETYLDATELTQSQRLVILDDYGKRWNVLDELNTSGDSGSSSRTERKTEVILERWTVDMSKPTRANFALADTPLPTTYKKCIVVFRSLCTYSKFLPAWKFARRLARITSKTTNPLRVKCRVLPGRDSQDPMPEALTMPLYDSRNPVIEGFSFGSTETLAGTFSIKVSYRLNCDFRVDDSEALLSSHFMGMDEHFFRPSLETSTDNLPGYLKGAKEPGSLPAERKDYVEPADPSQAYGSMSTYHQVGPLISASPLTALRAVRDLDPESPTSPSSPRPSFTNRFSTGSNPTPRYPEGAQPTVRRPSVSFKPFKAPSLSASPLQNDGMPPPQSPRTANRGTGTMPLTHRSRASLGSVPQSALRGTMLPPDNAIASSASGSPRHAPITKYTSSFSHRKGRPSTGGTSKAEDDNSSGKGSLASSTAQPGSGMLNEGGTGASSGSMPIDGDDIGNFLKMLDSKKHLKSFDNPTEANTNASTQRTSAALSKFHKMRDSNAALSDSLSSSMLLQRSSSSSSRQLSSVPPMISGGGTSISTASSPGKPHSPHTPHTPHTPAIPSRLSANSIAEYTQPHRSRTTRSPRRMTTTSSRPSSTEAASSSTARDSNGATAIDIPTSPRQYQTHVRRSSSVVQAHRPLPVEDEIGDLLPPFNVRSASMGAEERNSPPSLSALLGMQESSGDAPAQPSTRESLDIFPSGGVDMARQPSSDAEGGAPRSAALYRARLARQSARRGLTPPGSSRGGGSSYSSLGHERGGSASGSGIGERPGSGRAGAYSFRGAVQVEDDEPLLFAMSELSFSNEGRRSADSSRRGNRGGREGERGRGTGNER